MICGLFGVDPGRLALPSRGGNTRMLLYTLRARIHKSILKQKNSLLKEFFWCHLVRARNASHECYVIEYSKSKNYVKN